MGLEKVAASAAAFFSLRAFESGGFSGFSGLHARCEGRKQMNDPAGDAPHVLLERLAKSRFRAGFHLGPCELSYLSEKGMDAVLAHAAEFIGARLAPALPVRDGRQTPLKGHPAFIAQHATGSCCRSCLKKWHGYEKGIALGEGERNKILAVLHAWLVVEARRANLEWRKDAAQRELF